MRCLRVLHVIWGLPPGGAERQVVTLARAQAEHHEVRVCCLEQGGALADELEAAGIPVEILHKRPGLDLAAWRRLAGLLRCERIELVHSHIWSANLWARLATLRARTPLCVIHEHSAFSLVRLSRRLADRLLSLVTNAVLCVSAEIARGTILQSGVSREKALLVRNGLVFSPERFPPRRPPAEGERARILIVGSLEPRKDHATFLRAAGRLLARGADAEFLIAGDGPLRELLEVQARGIDPEGERIRFLGVREDVASLLSRASLYVSSSVTEGVSLALLEAMAAGVPVVATAVGGTVEVACGGKVMMLVPPRDPESLATAMEALLDCRGVGPVLAEAARALVRQRFDATVMNRRILGLYEDLAARRDSPRLPVFKRVLRWTASRVMAVSRPLLRLAPQTLRILTYHRVRDGYPGDRLSVSTAALARHLMLLRDARIPVLRLDVALERLRAGALPEGAVSLTFDDGYADLLESALDILAEFDAVATAYLPSALVEAGGMIDRYRDEASAGRLLTWEEAARVRDRGWEIGSHSATHADLSALDPGALEREAAGSRALLAARLGMAPASFCFPGGRINAAALAAVRRAGYESAVTVAPGANRAATPLHLLRRTEVSGEDSVADLACKLRGGFDLLHRLRQRGTSLDPEGLA